MSDKQQLRDLIVRYLSQQTELGERQLFLDNLVGSQGLYATDAIESYLRDIIVARLAEVLADELESILDLPGLRGELAGWLCTRVGNNFARQGLELADLWVGAVTPPPQAQKVIDGLTG